jgi:hypothetical protein
VGYKEWFRGDDLRGARGHTAPPPRGAAPRELTRLAVEGEWKPSEEQELSLWKKTAAPGWIRDADLTADVAAAMSFLPDPKRWKEAVLYPSASDGPWTLTVTPKGRAYPITVEVPGGGEPGSGGAEVIGFLRELEAESWSDDDPFGFEIFDSV